MYNQFYRLSKISCIIICFIILEVGSLFAQGPVVIELFTSEGCSSCPPADNFLREIIREAKNKKLPIYALAFHVDYWDYLGWKDAYAKPEYTNRQRNYAKAMGLHSLYTPQIVINGTDQMVASDKQVINRAIDRFLSNSTGVNISLKAFLKSSGEIQVIYTLEGSLTTEYLNIAIVQTGHVNYVTSGENSGKRLYHEHVVRAFKQLSLENNRNGEVLFHNCQTFDPNSLQVIAYLQNKESLRIHSAKQVDVRH